ncbi:MAG: hypothetical protein J3K34DRAFT_401556 [Monoraphidium minutum]|nr:MAG: hypothetical protein J3K34DRAFT_401556 [Monoraphidium minutum]
MPALSASCARSAARHSRSEPWVEAVTSPLGAPPAAAMLLRCARTTSRRGRTHAIPTGVVCAGSAAAVPALLPCVLLLAVAQERACDMVAPREPPPQSLACAGRANTATSPLAWAVTTRPHASRLAAARSGLPTSPTLQAGASASDPAFHTSSCPLSWPVSSWQQRRLSSPTPSSGTRAGSGPPPPLQPRPSGPTPVLQAVLMLPEVPRTGAAHDTISIVLHAPWAPQRHTSSLSPVLARNSATQGSERPPAAQTRSSRTTRQRTGPSRLGGPPSASWSDLARCRSFSPWPPRKLPAEKPRRAARPASAVSSGWMRPVSSCSRAARSAPCSSPAHTAPVSGSNAMARTALLNSRSSAWLSQTRGRRISRLPLLVPPHVLPAPSIATADRNTPPSIAKLVVAWVASE